MSAVAHIPKAPVIDVRNLSKSYRTGKIISHVLVRVNLSVLQGECLFLAGPSGSGKSTLLSILGCILSADSGELTILGKETGRLSKAQRIDLRRYHIGFVFQRFQLIRGLTALENVQVPLRLQGVSARAARQRATGMLEAVDLSDVGHSYPHNMSSGQCQRVALARALSTGPDLILADEPTASLDAENGRQVMQLLRRLVKQQSKTAIVVTHDVRIFEYADRVLNVEDGSVNEAMRANRRDSTV